MFLWCAYNQRFAPIQGSTQPLDSDAVPTNINHHYKDHSSNHDIDIHNNEIMSSSSSSYSYTYLKRHLTSIPSTHNITYTTHWTQTGYKGISLRLNPFGTILYITIILTLLGLQGILAMLVFFYYMQQRDIFPNQTLIFTSDIQVLTVFRIAWGVAFALSFLLLWPMSIRSLFYRRCTLQHATLVAIYTPMEEEEEEKEKKTIETEDIFNHNTATATINHHRYKQSKDDSINYPTLKRTRLFVTLLYQSFYSFTGQS